MSPLAMTAKMPEPTDLDSQYKVLWGRRAAISASKTGTSWGWISPLGSASKMLARSRSVQGPHWRP